MMTRPGAWQWLVAYRRESRTVRWHTLDAQQEHAEVLQGVDFLDRDIGTIDLLLLAVRIAGTFPRTIPQVCEVPETLLEVPVFLFEVRGKHSQTNNHHKQSH